MSAETLRRAARQMRDVAAMADKTGVWDWRAQDGTTWWTESTRAGRYIQRCHPRAIFALADVFDRAADDHDETPCPAIDGLVSVARAWLGEVDA